MSETIFLRHLPLRMKALITLILLSFFLFSANSLRAQSEEDDSEESTSQASHEEINRGERFFKPNSRVP